MALLACVLCTALFSSCHEEKIAGGTPYQQARVAIENGQQGKLRLLLSEGLDPNDRSFKDLEPPLIGIAAFHGNLDALKFLISAGADSSLPDITGITPLMLAAKGGHGECVAALIDAGANVNAESEGTIRFTAIDFAFRYSEDLECIRLLLRAGIDENSPSLQDFPLYFLAVNLPRPKDFKTFETLHAQGYDPARKNSDGQSLEDFIRQRNKEYLLDTLEQFDK